MSHQSHPYYLSAHGPDAYNVAELGVGTNDRAIVSGHILENEKVFGTAHIALGNNAGMGGTVNVAFISTASSGTPLSMSMANCCWIKVRLLLAKNRIGSKPVNENDSRSCCLLKMRP
jgi:hypothetical protein